MKFDEYLFTTVYFTYCATKLVSIWPLRTAVIIRKNQLGINEYTCDGVKKRIRNVSFDKLNKIYGVEETHLTPFIFTDVIFASLRS